MHARVCRDAPMQFCMHDLVPQLTMPTPTPIPNASNHSALQSIVNIAMLAPVRQQRCRSSSLGSQRSRFNPSLQRKHRHDSYVMRSTSRSLINLLVQRMFEVPVAHQL